MSSSFEELQNQFLEIRKKSKKDQFVYMKKYLENAKKSLNNSYNPTVTELELFDKILLEKNMRVL